MSDTKIVHYIDMLRTNNSAVLRNELDYLVRWVVDGKGELVTFPEFPTDPLKRINAVVRVLDERGEMDEYLTARGNALLDHQEDKHQCFAVHQPPVEHAEGNSGGDMD